MVDVTATCIIPAGTSEKRSMVLRRTRRRRGAGPCGLPSNATTPTARTPTARTPTTRAPATPTARAPITRWLRVRDWEGRGELWVRKVYDLFLLVE